MSTNAKYLRRLAALAVAMIAVVSLGVPASAATTSAAAGIIVYNPRVTDPAGRNVAFTSSDAARGVSSRSFLKCPISGHVCLHTPYRLDDNRQYWATFQLWEYGTYSLSGFNYNGQSELQNHQFGGAVARTERRDHSVIACFPDAGTHFYAVNYYPVWHVDLSAYPWC